MFLLQVLLFRLFVISAYDEIHENKDRQTSLSNYYIVIQIVKPVIYTSVMIVSEEYENPCEEIMFIPISYVHLESHRQMFSIWICL